MHMHTKEQIAKLSPIPDSWKRQHLENMGSGGQVCHLVAPEADPEPRSAEQAILGDMQRTGTGEKARDMGGKGNQ